MAYQEHPVYHDPGSNQWFGMQAWSMERIAEFYYISNNALAKALMDKWVTWVKPIVHLLSDGTFEIPSTLHGQDNQIHGILQVQLQITVYMLLLVNMEKTWVLLPA